MRARLVPVAAGLLALGAAPACRTPVPRPAGAAAVTLTAGALPSGPEPTVAALPMPPLDGDWQPPSSIAGDTGALGQALRTATRVHVQLGPRLDGELWRQRTPELLARLGVTAPVAFLEAAPLAKAVAGPLPVRSIATGPESTGDIALDAGWRARMRTGAAPGTVVLAIDDAALDGAAWRALPAAATGSCESPLRALATGQEQGLAELEPFLDHADRLLWQLWRAELRTLLPRLREPLQEHAAPRPRRAFADAAAWREHECGHALAQYVEPYHRCAGADSPCALAPRLLLVGGVRVAAPEPSVFVPDGCDTVLGQDVVAALRGFGRDAAEAASSRLDERQVVLADRLGAITEVHAALEDVCTPRRRRFAPADLDDAHTRLGAIGRALGSDEPPRSGAWSFTAAAFHVAGLGPVHEFARYDAGPGSPSHAAIDGARALRQFVLSRAVCRAGMPALPLALLAYEPAGDTVRHFGYLYEEELACGALGPLGFE